MMSFYRPSATGLAFHRKRQTVQSLANERPQSLQSFYDVMYEAVREIEWRIELVEKNYYADCSSPEHEIKRWLQPINTVLKATRTSNIQCLPQLEQITFLVKELSQEKRLDEGIMDKVNESVERVLKTLEHEFEPLIEDVQNVASFLGKYCLSFFEDDTDSYMDTVIGYNRQIQEFKDVISSSLDNIGLMVENFKTEGLILSYFSSAATEIGHRAECPHVPYLLIFVESCENIRTAIDGLRKWLNEDADYAMFVKTDLSDIDKEKYVKEKHFRDTQQKTFQLEFKLKATQRALAELVEQSEKLKDKESSLISEEKALLAVQHELQLDLELKVLRKEYLRREASQISARDFGERNERLIFETSALKDKLQTVSRRLEEMRTKTKWLTEKRELRKTKETEVQTLKKELKIVRKEVRAAEIEYKRTENCHCRLKQIYIFKTSPDALKKVFLNMPLDFGKGGTTLGRKTRQDPLDKAVKVIARYIEGDWMRFYSSLPFFPGRGEETLRQDMAELSRDHLREAPEKLAKHSLARWRRVHTRATVADLRLALTQMKRDDIVKKLDKALVPKPNIRVKPNRLVRFPNLPAREKKCYKFNF